MENNTQTDVNDLYKKNKLTEKTVIILLSCMIGVLVIFIIGTQFINSLKYNDDDIVIDTVTENSPIIKDEGKVNINSDDIFELCSIPGIGESKARAIIEYRRENGDITDINELLEIRGIGEKILENISEYIYIE